MQIFNIIGKFRLILSKHQKLRIVELLLLMILGGILETFSVSLILPFMEVVTNPDKMMSKWYIRDFCSICNIQTSETFIVTLAISLVLLYVLKSLYLVFECNIQYRFVYGNMFSVQSRLLEVLINRPYEYFLSVNSGEVIRIVNSDPNEAFFLLVVLLSMFTEIIVSIMLLLAIFIMTPIATIIILFLLVSLLLFTNFFVKPIIRNASLTLQQGSAGMNKWLLQAIQGIKELKVLNTENFFLQNYQVNGQKYVQSRRKYQILTVIPRYTIEGVCMSAMFIAVAAMVILGIKMETIIPVLTAIAMATIRLLPSITRISSALTQIAYGEPMLDKMIENMKIITSDKKIKVSSNRNIRKVMTKQLTLSNITFSYSHADRRILDQASLNINAGEAIGIVGPSGAGKTTLADIILGLLKPQKGQFFVDGEDITSNVDSLHSQIGYIPQTIFMLDDTIAANIAFGVQNPELSLLNRVIKDAALEEFINELPGGLQTQIGERGIRISGGQRQRIGIARALYRQPNILILDEATSALDHDTEEAIMESINHLKGKKTMIIIAHRLSTIQNCDHVYRVENGKIMKER